MKKHNLVENNGLSLSQAQSISNLCYQETQEIERVIDEINNSKKTVKVDDTDHEIQEGHPMPDDIVDLILKKGKLHACQAYLMENIKAKKSLLDNARIEHADFSELEVVIRPKLVTYDELPPVGENWGWSQLTASEINEFTEAEAMAAHIGQFIHKGSKLDKLRRELSSIGKIEWIDIKEGERSVVTIEKHHNAKDLLEIHNKLAGKHREFEQKVNYFKAKVKNLVTQENARIAKINSDAQHEAEKTNNNLEADYNKSLKAYNEQVKTLNAEFEKTRQENIKKIASYRIKIDARFQSVIDSFLKNLDKNLNE